MAKNKINANIITGHHGEHHGDPQAHPGEHGKHISESIVKKEQHGHEKHNNSRKNEMKEKNITTLGSLAVLFVCILGFTGFVKAESININNNFTEELKGLKKIANVQIIRRTDDITAGIISDDKQITDITPILNNDVSIIAQKGIDKVVTVKKIGDIYGIAKSDRIEIKKQIVNIEKIGNSVSITKDDVIFNQIKIVEINGGIELI